jgi:hypothetical protein
MLNFAYSAMRESVGLNVAYVTLELSEELVGLRFDYRCALRTKAELLGDPDGFLETLHERMDIVCGNNDLIIKGFKTKTCTGDTIRTWLDGLYAQHDIKIGMLIVDYLDLMKATRSRGDKTYLEAVDIAEDLRSLASKQEYHLPIWTACRATREAVGVRRISMRHMATAFERVAIADMVLALLMTDQEKAESKMRILPVACRNDGFNKVVNCNIDFERMLMTSTSATEPDFEDDNPEPKHNGSRRKKPQDRDLGEDDKPYRENTF